jgi:hypothetical protein
MRIALIITLVTFCAGCSIRSASQQPSRDGLLVITEESFTLCPPSGIVGGDYIRNEIDKLIPTKRTGQYDVTTQYPLDVNTIAGAAESAGETSQGLRTFFMTTLPRSWYKAILVPRMALRCRNKSNDKVWVVHVNWEYTNMFEAPGSVVDLSGVCHVATYVVDYNTGAIIRQERCN